MFILELETTILRLGTFDFLFEFVRKVNTKFLRILSLRHQKYTVENISGLNHKTADIFDVSEQNSKQSRMKIRGIVREKQISRSIEQEIVKQGSN